MRKIIFLFLALIINSVIYSQDSKVIIGLNVTPTITSLRGNDLINSYSPRFSYSAGLSIEYPLNTNASVKSAIAYERKGAKINHGYRDEITFESQNIKINYDYIAIPVLYSYKTEGRIKFYLDGGFFIGVLISQKSVIGSVSNVPEYTIDYTDNSKKLDIGLSFGMGLKIPLNNVFSVDLGLIENLGLLNTAKGKVINNGSVKTNSYGLQIGFKYKIPILSGKKY